MQTSYESAIEQCVGKEGEAYQAKKMRDSVVSSEKVSPFEEYSAKEWVNSDGHLKIPFDREEILKDADMTRVAYYIPDEVARSAKTDEQKMLLIKNLSPSILIRRVGNLCPAQPMENM